MVLFCNTSSYRKWQFYSVLVLWTLEVVKKQIFYKHASQVRKCVCGKMSSLSSQVKTLLVYLTKHLVISINGTVISIFPLKTTKKELILFTQLKKKNQNNLKHSFTVFTCSHVGKKKKKFLFSKPVKCNTPLNKLKNNLNNTFQMRSADC